MEPDSYLIKPRIEKALLVLRDGYIEYKMLDGGSESGAIEPDGLRAIFEAFVVITSSIVVGSLLRNGLCPMVRRFSTNLDRD